MTEMRSKLGTHVVNMCNSKKFHIHALVIGVHWARPISALGSLAPSRHHFLAQLLSGAGLTYICFKERPGHMFNIMGIIYIFQTDWA